MATMFGQQSQGYIQQIEAEIERLQQLLEHVQTTIHSEEEFEHAKPQPVADRKGAVKKSAAKKKANSDAAPKKLGRPKKTVALAEAKK